MSRHIPLHGPLPLHISRLNRLFCLYRWKWLRKNKLKPLLPHSRSQVTKWAINSVDSPLDKAEEQVVEERTTLFAIRDTHVPTTSSSLMVSVLVVRRWKQKDKSQVGGEERCRMRVKCLWNSLARSEYWRPSSRRYQSLHYRRGQRTVVHRMCCCWFSYPQSVLSLGAAIWIPNQRHLRIVLDTVIQRKWTKLSFVC